MTDDKTGQVQSELSDRGTKQDVENTPKCTRPNCILARPFGRQVSWRNGEIGCRTGLCWATPTSARPGGSGSVIEEFGPDDQVQVRRPQGGKGLSDDDGDEDNDDNEDEKDCNYIEDEEKSTQ